MFQDLQEGGTTTVEVNLLYAPPTVANYVSLSLNAEKAVIAVFAINSCSGSKSKQQDIETKS